MERLYKVLGHCVTQLRSTRQLSLWSGPIRGVTSRLSQGWCNLAWLLEHGRWVDRWLLVSHLGILEAGRRTSISPAPWPSSWPWTYSRGSGWWESFTWVYQMKEYIAFCPTYFSPCHWPCHSILLHMASPEISSWLLRSLSNRISGWELRL